MKRELFILFFILLSIKNEAQEYVRNSVQSTIFNYEQIGLDNHQFNFQTRILDYHIVGFTNSINIVGNTLEVKMIYDITELVVNIGNVNLYNNTLSYNQVLSEDIDYVKMSTNVIMIEDNPPYNPINIENVYFRIFDLNNLSVDTNSFKNKVSIYPNPAKENITISDNFLFEKAFIVNSLGQHVNTLYKNKEDIYDVQSLSNGIYYVSYYNKSNDVVGVSKLIKQN